MNSTDTKTSYGLYLQTRRVEKGVSIERVAMETRIREDILRAIEAEDHDRLPDDVFVKGFLKSFANAIGADPEETLRRFAVRRAAKPPAAALVIDEPRRTARWWSLLWATVVMASLIGGTLMIYQLQHPAETELAHQVAAPAEAGTASPDEPSPSADPPAVAEVRPASPESGETATEPATVPVEGAGTAGTGGDDTGGGESFRETPVGEQPDGYRLEIVCAEDTWLKVIADDAPATEHLLNPGDTLRLRAESRFNLLIGNAGGVSVQLNGNPVPVPGRSGEVVNLDLP